MKLDSGPLMEALVAWLGGGATARIISTVILLGASLVLFGLLWIGIRILLKRLDERIDATKGQGIKAVRIQRQRLFSATQVAHLLHSLVRIFGIALKLVLMVLFLNTVFSLFHWSRALALSVFEYMTSAVGMVLAGIVNYLPSLAIIIIIVFISRFAIKLLEMVFEGIGKERIAIPGFYPEWAHTSFNLARLFVIALTIIIVFPYLPGSGSPAFQGLSIFFGVLLSLGSSSAVANIISGIVITYTRAFQMGDRVRISDTEGDIIERSAFVTRIRTPKNVEVAIPNSMVMNHHIINFSTQAREGGLLLHTTVTIGYDVPWTRVHELLKEAARRTDKLENEPEPFVLQTSLDDNYVAYELNAYTHEASGKPSISSELHGHIQDCFREAGVEILSPHYRANRDGNASTVPQAGTPD